MSNEKENIEIAPASLETMTRRGFFNAQDKKYIISPIKIKEIEEFKADSLFNGYFDMIDNNKREALEKWIGRKLEYNGAPMTLETAMNHNWDVVDLTEFIRAIMGLSG